MRYVSIQDPGPQSKLVIAEGPTPTYGEEQMLVKVMATAINRADLLQRSGKYPPPAKASPIPGLELAGEVVAVGSKVTHFKPGDRVYALVAGGAYAEFCVVDAATAQHIPPHWDYTLAAALPEALTTAYATVFDLGGLQKGQTLLIHGAGSGISSLAIPMAKIMQAKVITSVGSADKVDKAKAAGAFQVIDHSKETLDTALSPDSIACIVDFVGGDYFNQHLKLLQSQGRLIQIAFMKGHLVSCDLSVLVRKRLQVIGFVLRAQSLAEKARLWQLAHQHWYEHLCSGALQPLIDSVFTLDAIEEAHARMHMSHYGKIVVTVT